MRNMLATMSAAASCSSRASLLTHYAMHSLGLGSGGYGVLLTAAGAGGLVSTVVNGPLATGKHVSLIVIGARLVRVPHAVPRSRTSARC